MKKILQGIKKVNKASISNNNGIYRIDIECTGLFPVYRTYYTSERPDTTAGQFLCNLDDYYSVQNELVRSLLKFFKDGLHTKAVKKHILTLFDNSLISNFEITKRILKDNGILIDDLYGHYYITAPIYSPSVICI